MEQKCKYILHALRKAIHIKQNLEERSKTKKVFVGSSISFLKQLLTKNKSKYITKPHVEMLQSKGIYLQSDKLILEMVPSYY